MCSTWEDWPTAVALRKGAAVRRAARLAPGGLGALTAERPLLPAAHAALSPRPACTCVHGCGACAASFVARQTARAPVRQPAAHTAAARMALLRQRGGSRLGEGAHVTMLMDEQIDAGHKLLMRQKRQRTCLLLPNGKQIRRCVTIAACHHERPEALQLHNVHTRLPGRP